jgi:hypothetical protein
MRDALSAGCCMVVGRKRYIRCAYCKVRFKDSAGWVQHIPCRWIKEAQKPRAIDAREMRVGEGSGLLIPD